MEPFVNFADLTFDFGDHSINNLGQGCSKTFREFLLAFGRFVLPECFLVASLLS